MVISPPDVGGQALDVASSALDLPGVPEEFEQSQRAGHLGHRCGCCQLRQAPVRARMAQCLYTNGRSYSVEILAWWLNRASGALYVVLVCPLPGQHPP